LGILTGLTVDEFDIVARAAKLTAVEANTVVFEQGADADRFFILVDGQVVVERDGERIASLSPGSFFGETALLTGGERSGTVIATRASTLWSVPYHAFRDVLKDHLLAHHEAGDEVRRRMAGMAERDTGQ
jgi:cGMP-dependent protein kinase